MKVLSEKLKQKNLKVTSQRLAIFHMLSNTTEHPSAETIYRTLESSHPSMSLATVYKTLDTLKKYDLIQELNVGEDSFRYDANNSIHPHFICEHCRKIYDLPTTQTIQDMQQEFVQTTNHTITLARIFLYGICKDCQS